MIKVIAICKDAEVLNLLTQEVFPDSDTEFWLMDCILINYRDDGQDTGFILQKIKQTQPNVILLDLIFDSIDGMQDYVFEKIGEIIKQFPGKIIVISDVDKLPLVNIGLIGEMKYSAQNCFLKRVMERLHDVIPSIVEKKMYIIKKPVVKGISKKNALTDRQIEILWYLFQDLTIEKIAEKLLDSEGKQLGVHGTFFHLKAIRKEIYKSKEGGVSPELLTEAFQKKVKLKPLSLKILTKFIYNIAKFIYSKTIRNATNFEGLPDMVVNKKITLGLIWFVENTFGNIIYPYFNPDNGCENISIKLEYNSKSGLLLAIETQMNEFDFEIVNKFNLTVIRKRMARINGRIFIGFQPSKGAFIELKIPGFGNLK
ncbi:MAG: DNA-binding response regulator [Saprospiraceae bacterium]